MPFMKTSRRRSPRWSQLETETWHLKVAPAITAIKNKSTSLLAWLFNLTWNLQIVLPNFIPSCLWSCQRQSFVHFLIIAISSLTFPWHLNRRKLITKDYKKHLETLLLLLRMIGREIYSTIMTFYISHSLTLNWLYAIYQLNWRHIINFQNNRPFVFLNRHKFDTYSCRPNTFKCRTHIDRVSDWPNGFRSTCTYLFKHTKCTPFVKPRGFG